MVAATQKTPDQAAALIQARIRGQQLRSKQLRTINAVTKLQARQRGRYTRKEFQKLLEFYNEQESFLLESKRRQLRLWHREQELYFLQHTTTNELEKIQQFQYKRSARKIQQEWKRRHPKPLEDVDISGLGKPFDPFGFIASHGHGHGDENVQQTQATIGRASVERVFYGELPKPDKIQNDPEMMARRRTEIRERLQRRRKDKDKENQHRKNGNKPTRRELHTTLVQLQQETVQKLDDITTKYRTTRPRRDAEALQLRTSSANRVAYLVDESRLSTMTKPVQKKDKGPEISEDLEVMTSTWSDERKRLAWQSHTRVLDSVLRKHHWYETSIAGQTTDIRRVYAQSPWENEKQVWQWPAPSSSATGTGTNEVAPRPRPSVARAATAMDRFMFGMSNIKGADTDNQQQPDKEEDDDEEVTVPAPLEDDEASLWWRAHATQSHFSYKRLQDKKQQQQQQQRWLMRPSNAAIDIEDAHVTPEMLVNPLFHDLYRQTLTTSQKQELKQQVANEIEILRQKIDLKVLEMENQVNLNTKTILAKQNEQKQQELQQTKEEAAILTIQRHMRGTLGRKRAKNHRAQFFVMVRGRAIRKGKCEECGDQQAVLECRECEESLHFCPICWVQVHTTRRRKAHTAIPMAVAVAVHEPRRRPPIVQERDVDRHRQHSQPSTGTTEPTEPSEPKREPTSSLLSLPGEGRNSGNLVSSATAAARDVLLPIVVVAPSIASTAAVAPRTTATAATLILTPDGDNTPSLPLVQPPKPTEPKMNTKKTKTQENEPTQNKIQSPKDANTSNPDQKTKDDAARKIQRRRRQYVLASSKPTTKTTTPPS